MAHYEPPHQDLRCLQIQLFSTLVLKELMCISQPMPYKVGKNTKLVRTQFEKRRIPYLLVIAGIYQFVSIAHMGLKPKNMTSVDVGFKVKH